MRIVIGILILLLVSMAAAVVETPAVVSAESPVASTPTTGWTIVYTEDNEDDESYPDTIDFNAHIRPILTANCTSCHGGVLQAGGVSFIYEDLALDSVEPGDPDSSYLIERVEEEDDESRMPPAEHGPRLSERDVRLLRLWIEQGAKWGKHWAYAVPQQPATPEISKPAWVRQPMDTFVLKKLDERNLQPAGDEIPERWLRRVSLDLIGLPPTLEQRDQFLASLESNGEQAYEIVVDRLLESKRFGERWGSVWFDLVRYADSRGQGEDSPREIWKYRDWVIKAFNEDMPYDQFTIKQLAGDLIPNATIEDHIATAVHRLTHTNEEGGTDDEEFRIEAVLDRVNTTWQTWQGTTFGCTQCHDHPYDPFAHDEYYKFTAYFNNTRDCDLSDDWPNIQVPINIEDYDQATELDREISRLSQQRWKTTWSAVNQPEFWTPLRIGKAKANRGVKILIDKHDDHDQFYTQGTIASNTQLTLEFPLESIDQLTGVRIAGMPLDQEKALSDSEWGFVMSQINGQLVTTKEGQDKPEVKKIKFDRVYCDDPFPRYDPNESLNKKSKFGFSAFTRIHRPQHAVLVLADPQPIKPGTRLRLTLDHRVTELASFPLVTRRGEFSVSADDRLIADSSTQAIEDIESQLAAARDQRQKIKSTPLPVLIERPDHMKRPSYVFTRGLFLTKDKEVQPDFPNSLYPDQPPVKDRLELAKMIVSDANPLTARVAVNRFWAQMFGVGIVATEEDFGSTGETPSHPLLLDDLSLRFSHQYGWSIKRLVREIALSRTYRQSSKITPEAYDQDSNNRWLARGPRHSLPAETVRDQILAISGLLSIKMYGPPVQPPLPPGVWKARRGQWKTPKIGDENRYRRSVYTYIKRSVPFPMQAIFDAPSRDFCQPRRLRSNTPLQPLMLMNDRTAVEAAQALATRMRDHDQEIDQQLGYGLELATCRPPKPIEVQHLKELYDEVLAESDDKIALQSVAAVLLNLDEIITK